MWGPDSHELFYITRPEGSEPLGRAISGSDRSAPVRVMRVTIDTALMFRPSPPVVMFEGQYRDTFDTQDGQRFLMIKEDLDSPSEQTEIVVVQNWTEELTRLVPVE